MIPEKAQHAVEAFVGFGGSIVGCFDDFESLCFQLSNPCLFGFIGGPVGVVEEGNASETGWILDELMGNIIAKATHTDCTDQED